MVDIAEGWIKMLINSELSEKEKERVKICGSCPEARILSVLNKEVNVCKKCGCFLLAKIRVDNQKCPLYKW